MNALIDLLLIFVFVYLLMYLKIIDISNMNIIMQKLVLTVSVLVFFTILHSMYSVVNYREFKLYNSFVTALVFAILAFIGQTIYNDMSQISPTDKIIRDLEDNVSPEVIFAGVTALAITFGRMSRYLFITEY